MRRYVGFSLIELLVVIAIVALVIAMLLPVMSRAREEGRSVVCRSHLKQVFGAQATFATDRGQWAHLWSNGKPTGWKTQLSPYLHGTPAGQRKSVHYCPSAHAHELDVAEAPASSGWYAATMGLNGAMQFAEWDYRPDNVVRPSTIIGLGEQPTSLFEGVLTADGYGVWKAGPYAGWYGTDNHNPYRGYRHTGEKDGANYAMMDGHVTLVEHEQLGRESGRWYWWNALVGDTSKAPADGSTSNYQMSADPSPSPTPKQIDTSKGAGKPAGPLRRPCGCPVEG